MPYRTAAEVNMNKPVRIHLNDLEEALYATDDVERTLAAIRIRLHFQEVEDTNLTDTKPYWLVAFYGYKKSYEKFHAWRCASLIRREVEDRDLESVQRGQAKIDLHWSQVCDLVRVILQHRAFHA